MRRRALALLALAVASAPRLVRAQTAPEDAHRVALRPPSCTAALFDEAEYLKLVAIELRSDGRATVSWEQNAEAVDVIVDAWGCHTPPGIVEVSVRDTRSGATSARSIDVHGVVDSDRPRVLALAAAELVRSAKRPPAAAAIPASAPLIAPLGPAPRAPQPAAPARAPALPARRDAAALVAELEYRTFVTRGTALLGGRVVALVPLEGAYTLRFDLGAGRGAAFHALGEIDVTTYTGAIGIALRSDPAPIVIEIGPRFEVGAGTVTGHAQSTGVTSESISGIVSTAVATAAVRAACGRGAELIAELEAGITVVRLDAGVDGARAAGVGGPVAALRLGIAVLP